METLTAPSVPPRCPRTWCPHHTSTQGWRWIRFGYYRRNCEPRVLQRFRCCQCGSTFTANAFTPHYYQKRPELLLTLAHRLITCAGYRQVSRELRCAHSTVMGQAARIARHAMLVLEELRPKGPVPEPLVIDGFESFAYSQYHPLYLNLVVGAE